INVTENGKYQVAVKATDTNDDIYVSQPYNLVLSQGVSSVGLATNSINTSVTENKEFNNVEMYPNPGSDILSIRNASNYDVDILSICGKFILSKKKIQNDVDINISGLENGIYMVRFTRNNSIITKKLTVHN
ncbi:MAG: T9SS type A sorting domain-containing protein, partial [Paludibacter sp.]